MSTLSTHHFTGVERFVRYVIEIISEPVSADKGEVLEYLDHIEEHDGYGEPTTTVIEFYRRVVARFPCVTEDPNGPWPDGPLINNFRHPVTILGISFSRVAEVLPWIISTANAAGFIVYDPQDEVLHRPTGSPSAGAMPQQHDTQPKRWWRFR